MAVLGFQGSGGAGTPVTAAGVPPSVAGQTYPIILTGPGSIFPGFTTATADVTAAAIVSGGTGYAAGNSVTLANGVILNVVSVTTGRITAVTITNAGSCPVLGLPLNPVAQVSTSGSGTGATFNLTWQVLPQQIIPAAVPPSVAGITQPQFKTGNATTPANLFPGHFSTSPPYPPIVIGGFNNVTLQPGNLTNPWRLTLPPTTPTVAILSLNLNSSAADDRGGGGGSGGSSTNVASGVVTRARTGKRAGKPAATF